MILTTGGRASGATSTRSSPRACAAAMASSIGSTPSCSPSFAITRTGLMRICLLTRIRWVLLFSITRAGLLLTSENETADPVSNSGSAEAVVGHRCPAPTTSAFDQHGLMVGHVARRGEAVDPGQHLRLAVDQPEGDGLEIVPQVARRGALVGVPGEVQLALLHDVGCRGEAGPDGTRPVAKGV